MKPWRSFPVPIVHTEWTVALYKEKPNVEGDKVQGFCDFTKRRIGLWMNPNEEALRACFWHEFAHALLYELGCDDAADSDTLVEGFAIGIMGVRLKVTWF